MLEVTQGKRARAQKIVIYGSEGIGKSTFAAKFPDPVFIDTEGGTDQMDIKRLPKPRAWEDLIATVQEVAAAPGFCGTLVIDTADWAEQLCVVHVCTKYKQPSIEGFGYGKGYTYLAEEWQRLLTACNAVIASGTNVIFCAHAKQRKQELPDEAGAFDRWEMKLSKQVAPLLKEWSDMLLFLNYKTYVVTTENKTNKAQGGKRVIYTSHHPCWDAKNRHGLPDELDLDFTPFAGLFDKTTKKKAPIPVPEMKPKQKPKPVQQPVEEDYTPHDQLYDMMQKADIKTEQLQAVVERKGHYPAGTPIAEYSEKFVKTWCIRYFNNIIKMIKEEQ